MTRYVLDTNTVSLILRRDPIILRHLAVILTPDNVVLGCPVVWYEVQRGLLAKDARVQMQRFEKLFATFHWQDYTWSDWELAAILWVGRRTQGKPIHDADLLIGVFARNRDAVLITDNEKDFIDLGVAVENWAKDGNL